MKYSTYLALKAGKPAAEKPAICVVQDISEFFKQLDDNDDRQSEHGPACWARPVKSAEVLHFPKPEPPKPDPLPSEDDVSQDLYFSLGLLDRWEWVGKQLRKFLDDVHLAGHELASKVNTEFESVLDDTTEFTDMFEKETK